MLSLQDENSDGLVFVFQRLHTNIIESFLFEGFCVELFTSKLSIHSQNQDMTYEVSVAEEQEWCACSFFTTNLEMLGIFHYLESQNSQTLTTLLVS